MKFRLVGVDFDKNVIEESGGSEDAIKNGQGIGNRSGAGEEVGNDKVILLESLVDYVSVELVEVADSFAGINKRTNRRI